MIWIIFGMLAVAMIINWYIVMGPDPRKWKGGKKDENSKSGK